MGMKSEKAIEGRFVSEIEIASQLNLIRRFDPGQAEKFREMSRFFERWIVEVTG